MLKSSSEEYTRMVERGVKLALRNSQVSFSLKRDARIEAGLHTNRKETTVPNNVKILYRTELLVKDIQQANIEENDTAYRFQCQAYFTGTQYSLRSRSLSIDSLLL